MGVGFTGCGKSALFVISNEVRNLSDFESEKKTDFSAANVSRFTDDVLRERNNNLLSFSSDSLAATFVGPKKIFSLPARITLL
jgi:hypothetical protein